jgi:hypothetical protein
MVEKQLAKRAIAQVSQPNYSGEKAGYATINA